MEPRPYPLFEVIASSKQGRTRALENTRFNPPDPQVEGGENLDSPYLVPCRRAGSESETSQT